jgi:hypothetical protein
MGTRHLTQVINKKGDLVISNYGQWDGYLEGQGMDIIKILNEGGTELLSNLEKNIQTVNHLTEDNAIQELYIKNNLKISPEGMVSMEDSDKFKQIYPSLHRDTGSQILVLLANEEGIPLIKNTSTDWVEYQHIINFQDNTYSAYSIYSEKTVYSTVLDKPDTIEEFQTFLDSIE